MACLLCLGFWQLGRGTDTPARAWAAQQLMQRSWEQVAVGDTRLSAWPWAHSWPLARLSAKSGKVDLIVLAGGTGGTLGIGPSHLSASSFPGERGNSVIAGHRDTHFRFLKDLAVGETLRVETVGGDLHVYSIVKLGVIDSRSGSLMLDTDDSLLSLVTGYPFEGSQPGAAMHYVVTARKSF